MMTRDDKIKKIFVAWDIHELIDMQLLAARAEVVRAMKLAQDDLAQRYGGALSKATLAKLAVLHDDCGKQGHVWETGSGLEISHSFRLNTARRSS
jgi:hypothetical protein